VGEERGGVRQHVRLRDPALDADVRRRLRKRSWVQPVTDGEQHPHVERAELRQDAREDAAEEVEGRRDAAEAHVDERAVVAGPPVGGERRRLGLGRRRVALDPCGPRQVGVLERRRYPRDVRRGGDRGLDGGDLVEPLARQRTRPLLPVRDRDRDARVRHPRLLGGDGRRVLVGLAQDEVRPPFRHRGAHARQVRARVDTPEHLAEDVLVLLVGRQLRHHGPDAVEDVLRRVVERPRLEAGAPDDAERLLGGRDHDLVARLEARACDRDEWAEVARAPRRRDEDPQTSLSMGTFTRLPHSVHEPS
jgi:hypothetical protein